MAVASYDAHFGITQDALARNGGRKTAVKKMTKEEYDRFMSSPAMMKQALQEEAVAARTSKRDKKRMETDPSFKPEESDWEQSPTFKFDRRMDYYRTLGVDEFEINENIKKAYRRLSLVYHPDKTRGLDDQTKEEYKQIFIELHNAYLVLADNPTRRQYDKARDDQAIAEELYGNIGGKKVKQFDAFLELEKRAREKSKPAVTVDVFLKVKLEKMFYGGIKRHMRARNREVLDGFVTDVLPYELAVPPLCKDSYSVMRKHAGDHHKDQKPDHLKFKLKIKDHALVKREGNDLHLRQVLKLHKGAIEEPYSSLETCIMGGRSLLLFGRNPFYSMGKLATSQLHVSVKGEGFGSESSLFFSVEYPSDHKAVEPIRPNTADGPSPSKQMVVTVKHRDTGGECCVIVDLEATFGAVLEQLVKVINLPGITTSDFTLHKRLVFSDGLGPKLAPSARVGTFDTVFCMGVNWMAASLDAGQSNELVRSLKEAVEAAEDAFTKKPTPVIQVEDVGDVSDAEPPAEVRQLLPYFGYPPTGPGLRNALQAASVHVPEESEDLGDRLHALAVGEAGGVYKPPVAKRAAAPIHPVLRQRQIRAQGHHMECHTDLVSLGPTLELATWPSSQLHFYGNVGQSILPHPGESAVRARPLYAVVLSCARGAKKCASKEWADLRRATMYLLVHTLWILVRPARALMPLQLDSAPAWHDEEAEEAVPQEAPPLARKKKPREPRPRNPAKDFVLQFGLGPSGGFPPTGSESSDEDLSLRGRAGQADEDPEIAKRCREVALERRIEWEELPLYPWVVQRPPRPPRRQHADASQDAASLAELLVPWSRLGDEALARGDAWMAYDCFTRVARAEYFADPIPGLDDRDPVRAMDERRGGASPSDSKATVASALARRSDCLQSIGDHRSALADARLATILRPAWSQAWRRAGILAARLGINTEARSSLMKAVELDPRDVENIRVLQRYKWQKSASKTAARSEKNAGNAAFKHKPAKAVATYTLALAAMEVRPDDDLEDCEEDLARLLAELHSNRSAAFARVGAWELALKDARLALSLPGRKDWMKGLMRLGTALLGLGRLEEAYPYFRRCELVLPPGVPDDHPAKLGCKACLSLMPMWKSTAGKKRLARFWKDGRRKAETTRVFVISDIHFDHTGADAWVARISNTKFQEDILIVAGDVADSLYKVGQCLRQLRYKFRRLFFVPGNHDLWVHSDEEKQTPDSFAKLFCLMKLCDDLDVDVVPAAVCEGVFIVPLYSWYNADFDEDDPFASSHMDFDKYARWPMDKDNHVWRYMLYLNRRFLEMPYPGIVLTVSHFLPRPELPYWSHVAGLIKAVGCPQLEPQLREVRSSCHVFGHSHEACDKVMEGVRYVQCPLGYQNEHSVDEPIRCVYDGSRGGLISKKEPIGD